MAHSDYSETSIFPMFRWVGYGLLLFAIFDNIALILPIRPEPMWVFQTSGAIVERVPVPLLGLILVFVGETALRQRWERGLLKLLSWMSLLLGLVFLAIIPLLLTMAMQVGNQAEVFFRTQMNQQMGQLSQMQQQVNQATNQDLTTLMTRYNQAKAGTSAINSPDQFKQQLLSEVGKTQESIKAQAETALTNRQLGTWKNAVKWSIGSLISSILFIGIWRFTSWTRRKQKSNKKLRMAGAA